MHMKLIDKSQICSDSLPSLSENIGSLFTSPNFKNMSIIKDIIDGAILVSGYKVSHLPIINTDIYPNHQTIRIIRGQNSNRYSIKSELCIAFRDFRKIPRIIWDTPKITAIFIFSELTYVSSFLAVYHFGSIPKEYTQSGSTRTVPSVLSE